MAVLKGLHNFNRFEIDRFLKDKRLNVTGCSLWKDYDSGQILGTKVEVVIVEDNTPYKPKKDGTPVSNLYEKLTFKVDKKVDVRIGEEVVPVNAVATVYGDYQNMLSIKASDIKVVQHTAPVSGVRPTAPVNGGKTL